jgi:hypothetical protein
MRTHQIVLHMPQRRVYTRAALLSRVSGALRDPLDDCTRGASSLCLAVLAVEDTKHPLSDPSVAGSTPLNRVIGSSSSSSSISIATTIAINIGINIGSSIGINIATTIATTISISGISANRRCV